MNELQRDFGRVEAKVEILTDDMKIIKADLATIKMLVGETKAVKESDWKRLSLIALLSSIATQIFNWLRPLFA